VTPALGHAYLVEVQRGVSHLFVSVQGGLQTVVSVTNCQLAGEPVIDTELSRTRADQPDKEEHIQDFRKVEEIVEPVKRRESFWHGGKLGGHDGDKHVA
jgi:hypothetical protein